MSSSHTHCHAHMVVGHIYKSVVNDTIAAVRSYFLDEGVDEQVLQELKQLWENKLSQSRAVPKDTDGQQTSTPSKPRSTQKQAHSSTGGMAAQPAGPASVAPTQSLVPIQITIPPQGQGGESKTIVVQVPVSAVQSGLAGQHLQTILSSPAAQATFALPPDVASNVLQRQLNEALRQPGAVGGQLDGCDDADGTLHRRQTQSHGGGVVRENSADAQTSEGATGGLTPLRVPDCDVKYLVGAATSEAGCSAAGHGTCSSSCSSPAECRRRAAADARLMRRLGPRLVVQLDGVGDSSDSDDDDDVDDVDDDVDDGDDSVLDDDDEEEQGQEDEPLNTEDDVSDHEPADLRETFNVMVCQYDKITRSRNKWKFYLKDGIMNLDGKDYIFQKANGDAEW